MRPPVEFWELDVNSFFFVRFYALHTDALREADVSSHTPQIPRKIAAASVESGRRVAEVWPRSGRGLAEIGLKKENRQPKHEGTGMGGTGTREDRAQASGRERQGPPN